MEFYLFRIRFVEFKLIVLDTAALLLLDVKHSLLRFDLFNNCFSIHSSNSINNRVLAFPVCTCSFTLARQGGISRIYIVMKMKRLEYTLL